MNRIWFVVAVVLSVVLCRDLQAREVAIIPAPTSMEVGEGGFVLRDSTVILHDEGTQPEARYLAEALAPATGFELEVRADAGETTPPGAIVLRLDAAMSHLGDEGYQLSVKNDVVVATAFRPAGVFYAVQTMRQLLPPEALGSELASNINWTMPAVEIEDVPRFAWRGHLFDCCRHFFDAETVKRTIDLLALHKMNRLHWHLTEDQGWRLEIKRYPKLTEVGAWRTEADGSSYGGYYTQEDVREIVEYAAARHIVVVPEIEMPGHSSAVLASYPFLGCTGGPYKVENGWGIFHDVYCAGSDETFVFIKNVLDEVMQMFPSQYIHIGGDECPKTRWEQCPRCQARIAAEGLKDEHELQSYFIRQADAYLTAHGRRLIGWDEILEGGLAPGAVVQSWRNESGGIAAAGQGHDVIMSPTSHCYLDYTYMTTSVEKTYSYEPVPAKLEPGREHHILGVEGNLWAEGVATQDRYDYQVFPRLTALSEVGWSPREARNWEDFKKRLDTQYERFQVLGVKYGVDEFGDILKESAVFSHWTFDQMRAEGSVIEFDATDEINGPGKYDVLLMYTHGNAAIEIKWVALFKNGDEIQRDEHVGWSGANKRDIVYKFRLEEFDPAAKYMFKAFVTPQGNMNSAGEVRIRKTALE